MYFLIKYNKGKNDSKTKVSKNMIYLNNIKNLNDLNICQIRKYLVSKNIKKDDKILSI